MAFLAECLWSALLRFVYFNTFAHGCSMRVLVRMRAALAMAPECKMLSTLHYRATWVKHPSSPQPFEHVKCERSASQDLAFEAPSIMPQQWCHGHTCRTVHRCQTLCDCLWLWVFPAVRTLSLEQMVKQQLRLLAPLVRCQPWMVTIQRLTIHKGCIVGTIILEPNLVRLFNF